MIDDFSFVYRTLIPWRLGACVSVRLGRLGVGSCWTLL